MGLLRVPTEGTTVNACPKYTADLEMMQGDRRSGGVLAEFHACHLTQYSVSPVRSPDVSANSIRSRLLGWPIVSLRRYLTPLHGSCFCCFSFFFLPKPVTLSVGSRMEESGG